MALVLLAAIFARGETPAGSERVRRAQARFIAPCCWHENLAVHMSPLAERLRAEVAGMLSDGATEEQVVDRFVATYGERILAEPRGTRFWILTATPILTLAIAGLSLILWLWIWSRRRETSGRGAEHGGELPDFDFD